MAESFQSASCDLWMTTGVVMPAVPPAKDRGPWLVPDGRELTRADYPDLFEVIGYRFSPEKHGESFRLPDGRNEDGTSQYLILTR